MIRRPSKSSSAASTARKIAPGYTEQNDPIAQRNTLERQTGGEQQKLDEDCARAAEVMKCAA